jgi:Flp pilus assembly pilin Flp
MLNRILCIIGLQVAGLNRGLSLKREEGQTLVEYALIIVTISIGVTVAMTFLRDQIRGVFSDIGNAL